MKLSCSVLLLLATNACAFFPQLSNTHGAKRPSFNSDQAPAHSMLTLAQEWAARNADSTAKTQPAKVEVPPPVVKVSGPSNPVSNPVNDLAQQWASRNQNVGSSVPQPVMARPTSPVAEQLPAIPLPAPVVAPVAVVPLPAVSAPLAVVPLPAVSAPLAVAAPPAPVKEIVHATPIYQSPKPTVYQAPAPQRSDDPTNAKLDQISEALGSIGKHLQSSAALSPGNAVVDANSAKLDMIADVLGNLNSLVTSQTTTESRAMSDLDERMNAINGQLSGITDLISEQNEAIKSHTRSISEQTEAIFVQTKHQRILNAMGQTQRNNFEFHYQGDSGRVYQDSWVLCDEILAHFLKGEGYCIPHESVAKNMDNRRFLPNSKENWMQRWEEDYDNALGEASIDFRLKIVGQLSAIMGVTPILTEENGWHCLYYNDDA